ncbi:ABC transporter ATP-binding protein [Actinokineospora sp. NPDC004072]
MLRARDLRFRYGRRLPWIVDGAGVDIAPGEVVGLHGPSGAGKSTFGRLLAGLLRPESGRVEADRPVQLALQHADRAMDPRWTIREVLAEASPAAADPELVAPAWLDRYPHELSGGELQRVNLARALLARPGYLVADEISTSLDALTQARVWRLLLARARAEGIGLLVISHDLPLLGAVADRTLTWEQVRAGAAEPAASSRRSS